MPKVSVIVPVYNVEEFIKRAIDSVLVQTLRDFELIMIDDCGSDNSLNICKECAKNDNRIVVIEQKKNVGPMMARQKGIDIAIGEFITFLDGDDTLPPDALKMLYYAAIESDADIVSGTIQYISNKGCRHLWKNQLKYGNDNVSVYKSLLEGEFGHNLCSRIFRKELLQKYKYKIFDNATNGEDGILFYQVIENVKKVVAINNVVYEYYQNMSSSSNVRLSERALWSMIQSNLVRLKTCGKIESLKTSTWVYVSKYLNALIAEGYNKNGVFKSLINRAELSDYVNPIKMIFHYPPIDFIMTMARRIIKPIIYYK